MNINTKHEERKTADSDGDEDWCIVPYTASLRPAAKESPQMLGKHEEGVTLNDNEFGFCVISSSDNKGDGRFIIEDENVLHKSDVEELLTAEGEADPRQKELDEDILQFSDSHFQLDENSNRLITTTLLHQANFHYKVIPKGNKIAFPDISTEENNNENVISPDFLDQMLQKSQSELDASKKSENLAPRYQALNSYQDDFCKVIKVDDGKLFDSSKKVMSKNLFIESLRELQEEINFEILAENEITEREDWQLLDSPQEDFCEVSVEDVVPFDEVCKKIIPNRFLSDVLSELQNEPSKKEEVENERLVPEQFQSLEYSQDDFCEVTIADVVNEFKSNSNLTNSFEGVSLIPCLSNTESNIEGITEKTVIPQLKSEDWSCCSSSQHNYSTTFFYEDDEAHNTTQDEIDLLIQQYQARKKKCKLKWEIGDEFWMKYEQWDSQPAMNKNRKVATFNRQRVRLTKKRICRKGHWNCKLITYHYS